ncbi:MAG: right-handed parallel beta-helix repeat-containing protein [Candidatus Scalindua rubra]|uniref:Periplasmic copper-binding protein NosD beta helix domain-containing protein n=1 Tax=Candidatus Scalindua brodae TaxID=237368 RepID=A0A0B0ERW7_9BACT|nr:MAG: hypothetical protein SCABRO_00836 [Candidatus Scalindua brodae]MBZ0108120.1 right-handed parallel beta-helix repeat-containing protein [Candidatus Scalindua rubra]TWU31261.1 hypothetical protein S225a_22070 [Candidatus Brocadiaceae bacterium S225]
MAGDYTKFSFKHKKNYSDVYKQQGRVSLDSDWNELSEITDRRWRSETIDIIGKCVVPNYTPDGFLVIPTGVGAFNIGIGRAYVDGIQAECHGLDPQLYDAVLGEEQGTRPVPYNDQPHLPAPLPSPLSSTGETDLIYLDVWRREVTVIEDPGIKEIALGGPDTMTRVQTAWQVKAITDVDDVLCTNEIQRWDDETRPSGGRLTTSTHVPPPDDNPCIISAVGGYRGIENRLYRVEFHTPGPPGTARFKWSRNNASIVASVTAINSDQITVESIGRDDILRFNVGDWIEIMDDHLEFQSEVGHMGQITDIDEGNRIITIDDPIPGSLSLDPTDVTRHTRIKRWDQTTGVDGDGLLTVPALAIDMVDIEDGIQVSFDLDPTIVGGEFKIGDYWVFYARTADGSIEILNNAPPRGIKHHYCRLALVTWGDTVETTRVHDCRTFWPPAGNEGCCTAVVYPGESIQSAIDRLPDTGGCICLKTGTHTITEPIRIEKSNVVLHGESPSTRVTRSNGVNLVYIASPAGKQVVNVEVEGIRFEVLGSVEREREVNAIVHLNKCTNTSVKNCGLAVAAIRSDLSGFYFPVAVAMAVRIEDSNSINITGNSMELVIIGLWALKGENINIFTNTIMAGIFRSDNSIIPWGRTGVLIDDDVEHTCHIERNIIENYFVGVSLGEGADRSVIEGNEILRPALNQTIDGEKLYAIDVAASNCFIIRNFITLFSPSYGGIKVVGEHACVKENYLQSEGQAVEGDLPLGIFMGPELEREDRLPDHGLIRNNTLMGLMDGILVVGADGVKVMKNHIGGDQKLKPRLAISIFDGKNSVVDKNKIINAEFGITLTLGRGNRLINNGISNGGYGILPLIETKLDVSGNFVENMRATGLGGMWLVESTTVTHNRFVSCGYDGMPPGIAPGIVIIFSFGNLSVESCEIENTGISEDRESVTTNPAYGIVAMVVPSCNINNNRVFYILPSLSELKLDKEDRALLLVGYPSYSVSDNITLAFGHAMVTDNFFHGPGFSHLIEFMEIEFTNNDNLGLRFEKVTFNNNSCEHLIIGEEDTRDKVTVFFWGSHLIVIGNHVKTVTDATEFVLPHPGFRSMDLNGLRNTLMGNVTTGDFWNSASSVPAPPQEFNIKL